MAAAAWKNQNHNEEDGAEMQPLASEISKQRALRLSKRGSGSGSVLLESADP